MGCLTFESPARRKDGSRQVCLESTQTHWYEIVCDWNAFGKIHINTTVPQRRNLGSQKPGTINGECENSLQGSLFLDFDSLVSPHLLPLPVAHQSCIPRRAKPRSLAAETGVLAREVTRLWTMRLYPEDTIRREQTEEIKYSVTPNTIQSTQS